MGRYLPKGTNGQHSNKLWQRLRERKLSLIHIISNRTVKYRPKGNYQVFLPPPRPSEYTNRIFGASYQFAKAIFRNILWNNKSIGLNHHIHQPLKNKKYFQPHFQEPNHLRPGQLKADPENALYPRKHSLLVCTAIRHIINLKVHCWTKNNNWRKEKNC